MIVIYMTNNWINHVKQYSKNNNMKYNEAMKDPQCKASYKKKGKGIMDDGLNYVKNEGKKYLKNKARELLDKGTNLIKDNYLNAGGLFGDITKGVSNIVLDTIPMPGMARDISKYGTNYLVDKSGLGIKRRKKRAGALFMA